MLLPNRRMLVDLLLERFQLAFSFGELLLQRYAAGFRLRGLPSLLVERYGHDARLGLLRGANCLQFTVALGQALLEHSPLVVPNAFLGEQGRLGLMQLVLAPRLRAKE